MTQSGHSDYLGVEQPVNALLGLGYSLVLPECEERSVDRENSGRSARVV
jgi:hypothetical protein